MSPIYGLYPVLQGSIEAWLLLRSLRTLHLRVPRQSANAAGIATWLNELSKVPEGKCWDGAPGGVVIKVWHSSIQSKTAAWDVQKQLEGGWNAIFKPKRYDISERITGLYSGFDRHNGEIICELTPI